MMVTALVSSILADVPVVAMMFPVALFLLQQNKCPVGESPFGKAVMLGIALAALIGGVGTPAGSGTNILTINMLGNRRPCVGFLLPMGGHRYAYGASAHACGLVGPH